MGVPLRVLLVEDSEDYAALLVLHLRRGGYDPAMRRVETPHDMSQALQEQAWDIVIADYNMPRFSAPAALALLQESGLDIPFIIVRLIPGPDAWLLGKRGFEFWDLAELPRETLPFDGHPNARWHAEVAAEVARRLEQRLASDTPPTP